ncbi:MAG: hypothetical protein KDA92_12690, partial [Planctomycetales bacterium]|nr:hypothetical protein [Planctomycetales bacterium]
AAPGFHRRTTLPAGWFKTGDVPGALTGSQVPEVMPVAHFDVTGDEAKSGVARRMRQTREATVFDDLPVSTPLSSAPQTLQAPAQLPTQIQTSPQTPVTSKATDATLNAASNTTDAAQQSSRRRPQGNVPSAVTSPNAIAAPSVTPTMSAPTTPPINTAVTPPTSAPNAAAAAVANQAGQQLPNAFVQPTVPTETTRSAVTSKTVETTPPAATQPNTRNTTAQLPSVMKRTVEDHGLDALPVEEAAEDDDRFKLTATNGLDAGKASAPQLDAVATATPESSAEEDDEDAILLANESPLISVVTRGPKTIVVGKPARYVVHLLNQNDRPAKDVVVRVAIPQWVEIAQHNPSVGSAHVQPDDAGNMVLAWNVDRFAGRGREKLYIDLVPRGNRPVDLGVTWTFSPAQKSTQIQVQEPKLHLTVVGPQDVLYGDTKVYTISVSNPGTGDAENVVLNLLPLVPGERPAGVRSLGTIPPGTRRTVEVELTTRQTGRLQVRAEATADGGLNARAQQEVVVRRASLEVEVEGPPMKYAGTRARYVIRVSNTGDAAASDINAVATLPAGAKEVASSDGGSLDPNTGQMNWHVGELRPGAARVFEVECTLMSPGDNRIDLRTVAAGDVSAVGSVITRVESLADLKLSVNDPQGAVAVGSDVIYEVRITNRGTKEAENIQVYGYFSEGIEPSTVAGWRGQVNEGEVVLQTIPRLGAGQEMVVRITAQASKAGDHVFRTELECTAPETKLAVEEWTHFYGEAMPTQDAPAAQQADRRAAPTTGLPVKPLKMQRY